MTLPSFLIVGAQKSGTTALFRYLEASPSIYVPARKELDFFSEDENWSRGVGWYEAWFADRTDERAAGEASPSYTSAHQYPATADRVVETVPEARLVYLVRDPVERIESHYRHRRGLGLEFRDAATAIGADPTYKDRSRYARQLAAYTDRFPTEQILVVDSDALRTRRAETVTDVLAFLGVDEPVVSAAVEQRHHETTGRRAPYGRRPWVRDLPTARAVARRLPSRLRRRLRHVVDERLDHERFGIPEAIRAELRAEFAGELSAIDELGVRRISV